MTTQDMMFLGKFLITCFIIFDPLLTLPPLMHLTRHFSEKDRLKVVNIATLVSGAAVIVFAIIGNWLLSALSISLAALEITGGILIVKSVLPMVLSSSSGPSEDDNHTDSINSIAISPIAIPLLAGPGTFTVTAKYLTEAPTLEMKLCIIAVVCIVVICSYFVLRSSTFLFKMLGAKAIDIIARTFGIILIAMGVQFFVSGFCRVAPEIVKAIAHKSVFDHVQKTLVEISVDNIKAQAQNIPAQ